MQTSRYLTGCFFTDTTGSFETRVQNNSPETGNADKNVTSTLHAAVNAGNRNQWLVLIRPQGTLEVCVTVLFLSTFV
jgi:cleavage and polyadenylation specificity factor subunit 1